ncbi:MAG TPA: MdtA/MuxA family multidrug efflux RND transporter periplasmic adaptor subunit [Candidatus Udaeobacter sp.]|nr:MdtA/MuxA family multidrug efflux RND transporter periplasmic adaptor subunit [Candidatus Udaeobacter sp.]
MDNPDPRRNAPGSPAGRLEPVRRPPSRLRRILWIAVVVLALAEAFVWYQGRQSSQTAATARSAATPPSPVVAAAAAKGDVDIAVNGLGTVTPLATVTVRTQIAGQLQQIAFTEGQDVEKGDFLALVDPRPYQAALDQLQGQLLKDQALLQGAEVDLARFEKLSAQNSIARQQVDDQHYLVLQYEGTVKSDQAQVANAQLNLTYCHIVAPVAGRVGLRQVDQGNYVQTSDTNGIVVITELHPISVIFTLPEDDLPPILKRLGAGATLPVTAYDRSQSEKLADGVLNTLDNQIDTTTGTVKLRAQFDNKDESLFPNQFVNVRLLVDVLKGAVVIPTAAIQRGAPGTFVYLIGADNKVSVRKIILGPIDGERAAVQSGLGIGDRVVIDGADKLREGAAVVLRSENGSTAPGLAPAGQAGKKTKKKTSSQ